MLTSFWGVFQLENGHIRNSHVWWCYIEAGQTIWERNGPIETPSMRGIIAKWLRENA